MVGIQPSVMAQRESGQPEHHSDACIRGAIEIAAIPTSEPRDHTPGGMSGYSLKPGAPLEFDIKRGGVDLQLITALWRLFRDPDIECPFRRKIGKISRYEFHPALAVNSISA
jgi:hypothetical protein